MNTFDEMNETFQKLKKDNPRAASAFVSFSQAAKAGGALPEKHKHLILTALAVYAQCVDCINVHVRDALQNGASQEEIIEAAFMAVVMGGGPALMSLKHVYAAIEAGV